MAFTPTPMLATVEDMVAAFTRDFLKSDGVPADWKGREYGTDEDGQQFTIQPYTGAHGRGKWTVSLSSQWGDFEVRGTGELTPPRLESAIGKLRGKDAARQRVDRAAEAERLGELADKLARAQEDRRYRAVAAFRDLGMSKSEIAAAARISRPTLDAWLADAEDKQGPAGRYLG